MSIPFRLAAAVILVASCTLAPDADASGSQPDAQELKRLSLEQLMDLEITGVDRQPGTVGTSGAAVSVITRDDIRRSGVTTIPDALALADGVHVARFNNGTWAISARGFNGSTPNKLLVLVDGRAEFSPLFTGVFWNVLDYVLEDIERIEVIQGPGATMWGANAVNGVINIVTRHSRETTGTFVSAGSGNEDPALVEARHGGTLNTHTYRVYGKFAQRDAQRFSTGGSSQDTRRRGLAGFRIDSVRAATEWRLNGDIFHSRDDFPDRRDGEWTGITLQGAVRHERSPTSSLQLQASFRREYRNIERQLTHHLNTADVDFQHAIRVASRHDVIWGAGFRSNHDVTHGSAVLHFDPAARSYPVANVFVQDEFALRPESVFLTAGVKVEHNAFSGSDWQPNVRARWLLPHQQTLWGSVARAIRRPTRFDEDIRVTAPSGVTLIRGSDEFRSEQLTAWEMGYRANPVRLLSVEATWFEHHYDRLRSQEAPLTGVIPVTVGNTLNGRSRGVVLGARLQPAEWWMLHTSYARLSTEITRDAASRDVSGGVNEANDPSHVFLLRSSFDVTDSIEADAWLRGVGALPNPAVPAYAELNARVSWRPGSRFEFAVTGQDLLHGSHPEFGTAVPRRIEFERSVRATISLRIP